MAKRKGLVVPFVGPRKTPAGTPGGPAVQSPTAQNFRQQESTRPEAPAQRYALNPYQTPLAGDVQGAKDFQYQLAAKGLYKGAIDGVLGPKSQAAYDAYLKSEQDKLYADARETTKFGTQQYDSYVSYQQSLNKQAAEARQKLKDLAALSADKKGLESFSKQALKLSDPLTSDNAAVIDAASQAEKLYGQYQSANKQDHSFKGRALHALGAVGSFLNRPVEELLQPYYASKYVQTQGGNNYEAVNAFTAGLPGLGGLARKDSRWRGVRAAIEATNSPEERRALTEQGQLASFGQFVSGRYKQKLDPAALARYQGVRNPTVLGGTGIAPGAAQGVLSAGADAGLQLGLDPLPKLGHALKPFAEVGEMAGTAGLRQAAKQGGLSLTERLTPARIADQLGPQITRAAKATGREAFITESARGTKLVDATVDAVVKLQDAELVAKRVTGMTPLVAKELVEAAKTGGRDAVKAAVEESFTKGEWAPTVKLGTQARLASGLGGKGTIASHTTLRAKLGERLIGLASGTETRATITTSRAAVAAEHAIDAAMRSTGALAPDFYSKVVKPVVSQFDRWTRLSNVYDAAEAADSPALVGIVDDSLRSVLGKKVSPTELNRLMNNGSPELDKVLERVETLVAIKTGDAGSAAAERAGVEIDKGFKAAQLKPQGIVDKAAGNLGLDLPKTPVGDVNDAFTKLPTLKATSANIERVKNLADRELVDTDLADSFKKELDNIASNPKLRKAGLGKVVAKMEAVATNPELLDEAGRIQRNLAEQEARGAAAPAVKAGLAQRLAALPAKLALSMVESVPPSTMAFEGGPDAAVNMVNRMEAMDRWSAAIGQDAFTRGSLRAAVGAARSEEELFVTVRNALRREAEKQGVDANALIDILEYNRSQLRAGKATLVDDATGELLDSTQVLSQRVEDIPLPDPADIRRTLDDLRAAQGSVPAKLRKAGRDFVNADVVGGLSVNSVGKGVHRAWKFSIVTNLYAPAVGAVAGYVGTDGDVKEKLRGAGIGALIGSVGPARYLGRVVGIDEKVRFLMERGFVPEENVPVLSRWARRHGIDPAYRFRQQELIRASADLSGHLKNPLLVQVDKGWVRLGKNEARFVDGWWRIVNYQLHAESDVVAEAMLRAKAGVITDDEATKAIAQFFKTEDGALFVRRMKSGFKGPKSEAEIIDRYKTFIDTYVPQDIALARIDGQVSHETLKAAVKLGDSPEAIHAQKTWRIPKSPKEAADLRGAIASRFVLEGPTTALRREPLAEWIYRDEFLRMVDNGVDPARAQSIAESIAVKRTNNILFNVNDESRFAKKVDFVFPFQQPREEVVRVWGKVAINKPGRSMIAVKNVAKAFNAGAQAGIFTKDPVFGDDGGEWTFTVPGSAYIGQLLFGHDLKDGFRANVRDLLFVGQGAYGVGIVPSPGGPWWTAGARAFLNTTAGQDVYSSMPGRLREVLFPYGANGQFLPKGSDRLWMAMTADTPPWEFASEFEQEAQLNKIEQEVTKHLIMQHRQEDPADLDWVPADAEIKASTKSYLKAWALFTNLSPAGPRPIFIGEEQAKNIRDIYTDPITGQFDKRSAIRDNPTLEPYLRVSGKTKYVGPDDWKHWSSDVDFNTERLFHNRTYKSATEYKKELTQAREWDAAWTDYWNIRNDPDKLSQEDRMVAWREEHPDLAAEQHNDYFRDKELAQILHGTPLGERDRQLDSWRQQWDVSKSEYPYLKRDVESGKKGDFNPWAEARNMEDVREDVDKKLRRGFTEKAVVGTLAPVEQVRYYTSKLIDLSKSGSDTDPSKLMDDWNAAKAARNDVYKANPSITRFKPKTSVIERYADRFREETATQVSAAFDQAAKLKAGMETAKDAKDWNTYYALKAKRDAALTLARELKNKQYRESFKDVSGTEEMKAVVVFTEGQNKANVARDLSLVGQSGVLVPSNEEAYYLGMPPRIRKSFVDDLAKSLDTPSGQNGKLFWEWLTDFQKDLLESNMPDAMVSHWKEVTPETEPRQFVSSGDPELDYAKAMMQQYTKRGPGEKAPAGYQEYLSLPNNAVVKSDFLKKHPDVVDWLKKGPMANMPEHIKGIVTNIMIRKGEWQGEETPDAQLTDLVFAHQQLETWNKRGERKRPNAYDDWVNMPTGPAKAEFMRAHPEIKEWLQLGPMANMPEQYQDVVRDIMTRYGEWTQGSDDPLGKTVEEYYRLPEFARKQYLVDHPELTEYWAALRGPEEQKKHELADAYFALPSGSAKRLFLSAHPELQQFFVDQRTARYEKFLNKVAQYMGTNPELFSHYLDRQQDVLADLLNKFGTPNLVREIPRMAPPAERKTGAEGSRKRQPLR